MTDLETEIIFRDASAGSPLYRITALTEPGYEILKQWCEEGDPPCADKRGLAWIGVLENDVLAITKQAMSSGLTVRERP